MTARQWRVELGNLRPLTLNGSRGNPHAHARAVRAMRTASWAATKHARVPALARVSIELHYAPKDRRRRDPMNLVATLKPVEDGMVDAGVIPDDTPEFSVPTAPVVDDPTGVTGLLYVIVREVGQ